jgi:hypothetical protein
MPPTVELCTHDRDGHPCLGRIHRPTPETAYCYRCGGAEAGVIYAPQTARQAHAHKALAAFVHHLRAAGHEAEARAVEATLS